MKQEPLEPFQQVQLGVKDFRPTQAQWAVTWVPELLSQFLIKLALLWISRIIFSQDLGVVEILASPAEVYQMFLQLYLWVSEGVSENLHCSRSKCFLTKFTETFLAVLIMILVFLPEIPQFSYPYFFILLQLAKIVTWNHENPQNFNSENW